MENCIGQEYMLQFRWLQEKTPSGCSPKSAKPYNLLSCRDDKILSTDQRRRGLAQWIGCCVVTSSVFQAPLIPQQLRAWLGFSASLPKPTRCIRDCGHPKSCSPGDFSQKVPQLLSFYDRKAEWWEQPCRFSHISSQELFRGSKGCWRWGVHRLS